MNVIYEIIIRAYLLGIRVSSLWNSKARKWVDGRKTVFDEIKSKVNPQEKKVWFHCASLGEFEQARPVIELFKQRNPSFKIVLTFFSPSGYEIRKNYSGADYIFYLPADTAANARKFLELTNPVLAVFAKYDFWFNYLQTLQENKIPVVVFSSVFRKDQYFFQEYGQWFLKILSQIDIIYVQDEQSRKLLRKVKFDNAVVCGDTRFDRVMQIAAQPVDFPLIEKFKSNTTTIVAGSTWKEDERILIELIRKRKDTMKFIIAPHETDESRIAELMAQMPLPSLRFSQANEQNITGVNVLVIDSVGILSQLYRYADLAFVGGGFGKGIHNILEPAAFSVPVIIGPNYKKFNEAVEMVNLSMAFTIDKFRQLDNKVTDLFFIKGTDKSIKKRIAEYMKSRMGATQQVVEGLEKLITATK